MKPRANGIDQHVAKRLSELMAQCGTSDESLARELEVSFQQVAKYRSGINRIAAGRLYVIAEALGVPTDWFFEGIEG